MTVTDPIDEAQLNRPAEFGRVVAAARKRLFAVFDDPREGLAAVQDVPAADLVAGEQVWLLHGEEGRRRLDARGAGHGLYGRVVRLAQRAMSDDNQYLDTLDRALRGGALVAALPVADMTTADRVAEVLLGRSGHAFAYTRHLDFVPTLGEI